jgi:hypothetical protein
VPVIEFQAHPLPAGSDIFLTCHDDSPRDGIWTCLWNAGDLLNLTAYQIRARGIDAFGNVGGWTGWITLVIDNTPPTVILNASFYTAIADGFMNGSEGLVRGQVLDDQRASRYTICNPREAETYCNTQAVVPGTTQVGDWAVLIPTDGLDGVWRTFVYTGIDGVGNRSDPLTTTFRIDAVPPVVTTTLVINQVLLSDYVPGNPAGGPVLGGLVSDGGGVYAIFIRLETPSGQVVWQSAQVNGDTWEFIPQLAELGVYNLRIEAYDLAGNARGYGPYTLLTLPTSVYYSYMPLIYRDYSPYRIVYQNDFETGAGSEWSQSRLTTSPSGEDFLGEYGNEQTCLSLQNLPAHYRMVISYDLYIIRSWDGNQVNWPVKYGFLHPSATDSIVGPDIWSMQVDATSGITTTFSNWDNLGFRQTYPGTYPGGDYLARTGADEINTLGYYYFYVPQDTTYQMGFDFSHTGSSLALCFSASQLQSISDESWGIDNMLIGVWTNMNPAPPLRP